MNTKDLLIIVVAIIIVLILAVFVKPIITGEPATILPNEKNALFPERETPIPTWEPTFEPQNSPSITAAPTTLIAYTSAIPQTPIPTPTHQTNVPTPFVTLLPEKLPIPQPTVNTLSIGRETIPREIGRVSINGEGIYIIPRIFPTNGDMRYSFAQTPESRLIQSYTGKFSTITNPIEIDSNYFTISYTVDLPEFLQSATPNSGDTWAFDKMYSPTTANRDNKDSEMKVESFSVNNPYFSITIIDAETGEVIRTIIQTNLDSRVWAGTFGDGEGGSDNSKYDNVNWDPRPWTENIFAGKGEYLFEIKANALNSFRVDILTPTIEPVRRDTERLLLALFIQRELRNLVSLFQRDDLNPAYDYFTVLATAHIADEEMDTVVTQQINNLKPMRGIVSGFTITDIELYDASPVLRGTLTINNVPNEEDIIIPWKIEIDSIPTYSSWYRGTINWQIGEEAYQAAWEYPRAVIQMILQLETEFKNTYANEAAFYHDLTLLETYSSDLMLLSAARYQGIDISSGIVPVLPEPYLIPLDIHKFITLFNADNYERLAYGENIAETLSKRINDAYTLDEIYQFFLEMRYAGITIKDFLIYSVDIRGNHASVRGEYIWDRNDIKRRTPCEIILAFEWTKPNQYTMWKMDTLPPLRF
jgi:hypothetical protein